jgi:uncharacterized protein YjdB
MPILFSPASARYKKLVWTSSDTSVATVSASGKITAVAKTGTATITATATSGVTAECVVTATGARPKSVKLDKTKLTLIPGGTYMLTETISPPPRRTRPLPGRARRSPSPPQFRRVCDRPRHRPAVITATTVNGKKAACVVYVIRNQCYPRTHPKARPAR